MVFIDKLKNLAIFSFLVRNLVPMFANIGTKIVNELFVQTEV